MSSDPGRASRPGPLRRVAADATAGLHFGVMGFLCFGWALPWAEAWWTYVVVAPIVVLGWRVFADACWLSLVEARLRGESTRVVDPDGETERARSFVAETIERVTGRTISWRLANRLSYGVVALGFVLAGLRLLLV